MHGSVGDAAVVPGQHVCTWNLAGNTATIGNPNLMLPLPAGSNKTKQHPCMAYQDARREPDFTFSNRSFGGGQWDGVLLGSTAYAVPANYDADQFGTDLNNGGTGQLNFVIPDQCDDMHGVTAQGTHSAVDGEAHGLRLRQCLEQRPGCDGGQHPHPRR